MLLNKRALSLFSVLTLVLSGFTSCVDNDGAAGDLLPENPEQSEALPHVYRYDFYITLGDDKATSRAGDLFESDEADDAGQDDFVKGDAAEHMIGSNGHYALFFRADGGFHSLAVLSLSQVTSDSFGHNGMEAWFASGKITVTPDDTPAQCILLVNAAPLYETLLTIDETWTLNRVMAMDWSDSDPYKIGRDNNGYFTMSNSVYYENGQMKLAVPITEANVQESTEPFDEKKVIHVPVERMAAKVTFKITDENVRSNADGSVTFLTGGDALYCTGFDSEGIPDIETRKWQATVTGWSMNALETSQKNVKNLSTQPSLSWNWNDPGNFRSYWAYDNNYNTGYYPVQFRKAVDVDLDYYGKQTSALKNYSFNSLDQLPLDRNVYLPENTYDTDALNYLDEQRLDKLAGTHLIVCSTLQLNVGQGNAFVTQDYYRDVVGVFYTRPQDCFWNLVRYFNNELQSQTTMKYYLYDWDGKEDKPTRVLHEALTTGGNYKLYIGNQPVTYEMVMNFPDDKIIFVRADIKGGDGRVLPWIEGMTVVNTETGETLPIYSKIVASAVPGDDDYGNLEAQNVANYERRCTSNDLKSLLLEWIGATDHFKDGKMYYSAEARINSTDCGVVRNAWYRYNLKGITKVGTPVDDRNQLIIPEQVKTENQINFTIDIIDWHSFEFTAPLL